MKFPFKLKLNKKYFTIWWCDLYGFLACAFLLLSAGFFQYMRGLQPCPLCIVQRYAIAVMGVMYLVSLATEHKLWLRIHYILTFLFAGLGGVAAGRQLYLQHLPAHQVPMCGPDLDYMLKTLPWRETLHLLLEGSGDCAVVAWHFLGLSMAGWTLLFFIGFMVSALIGLYRV